MTDIIRLNENELKRAATIIKSAGYVVALSGAGMSVDSGIPPFRGPGGLWTKYGEPPMDGYQRFLDDPREYWEKRLRRDGYLKGMYDALEGADPNPGHYALAKLEGKAILKTIITQNIDDLHVRAGSKGTIEIHGNFRLIRCIECNSRFPREEISLEVLPPRCPGCNGILKSDVVHFGEPIPRDVLARCQEESERCDCMLIIGTSAVVYPAAQFPQVVRSRGGSLIEVNSAESALTNLSDVSLRGSSSLLLPELVKRLEING